MITDSDKRRIDFARRAIKGRIAEVIFQFMFEDSGQCTIIPSGYENLIPTLAQYQHIMDSQEELAVLRTIPDFVLVKPDHTQIILVEAKYRRKLEPERVRSLAKTISATWPPAWLFLATLDGFYFSECKDIVKGDGQIQQLRGRWVRDELQDAYLSLLKEFER